MVLFFLKVPSRCPRVLVAQVQRAVHPMTGHHTVVAYSSRWPIFSFGRTRCPGVRSMSSCASGVTRSQVQDSHLRLTTRNTCTESSMRLSLDTLYGSLLLSLTVARSPKNPKAGWKTSMRYTFKTRERLFETCFKMKILMVNSISSHIESTPVEMGNDDGVIIFLRTGRGIRRYVVDDSSLTRRQGYFHLKSNFSPAGSRMRRRGKQRQHVCTDNPWKRQNNSFSRDGTERVLSSLPLYRQRAKQRATRTSQCRRGNSVPCDSKK